MRHMTRSTSRPSRSRRWSRTSATCTPCAASTSRSSEGEMFGFLGPNGAGKSTTIKILCTLADPTAARRPRRGLRRRRPSASQVRRSIGLVFQEPTLDLYLTAEQNLSFHGELYGVPAAGAEAADRRRCSRWSALADRRDDKVQTYSGGMKRRLEIGRGLLHSPRVLFLDEPTIGLDPQTRASIWDYVAQLRRGRGHHRLRHHALHGRGRALRPDRDHERRRDRRRSTHPDALKSSIGKDRVAVPHRRRRAGDRPAARAVRARGRRCTRSW